MDGKLKCPLRKGLKQFSGEHNPLNDYDPYFEDCLESKCAWWADHFCVVRVLAGKIEDVKEAIKGLD